MEWFEGYPGAVKSKCIVCGTTIYIWLNQEQNVCFDCWFKSLISERS